MQSQPRMDLRLASRIANTNILEFDSTCVNKILTRSEKLSPSFRERVAIDGFITE